LKLGIDSQTVLTQPASFRVAETLRALVIVLTSFLDPVKGTQKSKMLEQIQSVIFNGLAGIVLGTEVDSVYKM